MREKSIATNSNSEINNVDVNQLQFPKNTSLIKYGMSKPVPRITILGTKKISPKIMVGIRILKTILVSVLRPVPLR